jgi:hypothetical protein
MSGSHLSLIIRPIVIALSLATWISLVYYASFHPRWKHHAGPRRTDAAGGVFEATHGGRQLMPIWGEPGKAIPQQRQAGASEGYQAADAQSEDQARSDAPVGAGATASGSRQSTESGPTGSGWPPE